MKINMNSSGPSLCGSQREAGSPARVCSRQEQTFPCKLDSPHWLLQPAGMEGEGRGRLKAVSSAASQNPGLPLSLPPAPRQVNGLQGPAGSSGRSEERRLEWWPLAQVLSQVL